MSARPAPLGISRRLPGLAGSPGYGTDQDQRDIPIPTTNVTIPISPLQQRHRGRCPLHPLIIGLHGGGYDHQYFNATPTYSASRLSTALQVPFISIDRSSYGKTNSTPPIPETSDFSQETGHWLHKYILPKLWSEIGLPNQCTCIVLCHSFGVMGGIVAAALHAEEKTPLYALGGLIASGMWNTQAPSAMERSTLSYVPIDADHVMFGVDTKDTVMFKPGTAAPEILDQCEQLNAACPVAELRGFAETCLPSWKEKWAARVTVPVLFALVEDDPFFVATEEELGICVKAFRNSKRVDGSLVRGAPHCLELSLCLRGWYARCFGFALECAAGFEGSK
ncbi:hypothetical protein BO94DRAFT_566955 [Aspergillus sclerotioniger CBS 115572]|uniref:AB hydrolase-1 domain-containing protein n=1 Tax=Aspergillus sclerotioniger CBS 115572 TaxID=1450535 RepID=A0A317WBF8_9EURO|nr:hypothetical protein BO94DRAFT_566955 [Aspergillus sclerotioniger CBS 115572]PWY83836.1 hypothetical protein BO94DRAFT_566955 [Aspergillus sclerotioniger CBS 115572]